MKTFIKVKVKVTLVQALVQAVGPIGEGGRVHCAHGLLPGFTRHCA